MPAGCRRYDVARDLGSARIAEQVAPVKQRKTHRQECLCHQKLFGFEVDSVDYSQPTETELSW